MSIQDTIIEVYGETIESQVGEFEVVKAEIFFQEDRDFDAKILVQDRHINFHEVLICTDGYAVTMKAKRA